MIRANYHTHSTFCDGANTPEEMVARAIELGFVALGFSGHMDPEVSMDWAAYSAEVERLKSANAGRLDILLGAELDNCHDPSTCADAEYLIGSTHYIPVDGKLVCVDDTPERLARECEEHFGGDYYALARAYYDFEARVVERPACTFVGHFDLVTCFNDREHFIDEDDPRYLGSALACVEHLASLGVPLEINTGALAKGRKAEPYPNKRLLSALHDCGGQIVISSDAHSARLLDACFDRAVAAAVECGFTHANVLAHDEFGHVGFVQVALDEA